MKHSDDNQILAAENINQEPKIKECLRLIIQNSRLKNGKSNISDLSDYLICKESKNLLARFIANIELN